MDQRGFAMIPKPQTKELLQQSFHILSKRGETNHFLSNFNAHKAEPYTVVLRGDEEFNVNFDYQHVLMMHITEPLEYDMPSCLVVHGCRTDRCSCLVCEPFSQSHLCISLQHVVVVVAVAANIVQTIFVCSTWRASLIVEFCIIITLDAWASIVGSFAGS